ncbi:MAG: hypothetical protein GWM98_10185, partial [Nitrospinaceae bacterium]|nr:hypothetical protein [Nitrospinaceae bacterium]NIR54788.1 hypothetical protein [Nitrospinaceae bacterium]NIS85214.1 hypothetical protein [Nitrospinaceae bacterium]NIT82024.1 hypothetical protein [Nitrospinaceae bacterium]NIU44288.1 hypothetical protein [Nitrospinaceae bacterium]
PPSAATGPDATLHPNRAGFRELQRQLQEQMQKDPETLRWIQELQNHPDIQTILNDEALMRAIEQGRLDRV